jgi:dTDP-4-amino-4,6-dideoxygalactose transaminase
VKADRKSSWHLYILRLNLEELRIDRDAFIEELRSRGIGTSVHFIPLHLHPFYQRSYGYAPGDFPKAEKEFDRYLSLPIYPGMTDANIQQVIDSVVDIVSSNTH